MKYTGDHLYNKKEEEEKNRILLESILKTSEQGTFIYVINL